MLIVITGAGSVGFQLAKHLIADNKDVVLIEKDDERARNVAAQLDCIVLHGSAASISVLLRANIMKADFFISVTDSDELNMISCGIVSSMFEVPHKIARVRNLEYINNTIMTEQFLHIDYLVNPEIEVAIEIEDIIRHGARSGVISFEKAGVKLRSMLAKKIPAIIGKQLKDIRTMINEDFLIGAIERDEKLFIPDGNAVVTPGDTIHFISSDAALEALFKSSGNSGSSIRKLIIIGGTRLGGSIISRLSRSGNFSITVVERDYITCKKLAEHFPNILILHSDVSEESFFDDEDLCAYDLIICVTDNQEINILTSLYAKKKNPAIRTISLVMNNNFAELARSYGIDALVCPNNSSVDSILKFLRRGNISSVKSIFNGEAELLEFSIVAGAEPRCIRDLRMPKGSLILSITRSGVRLHPTGDLVIEPNDTVLVITQKNSLSRIEEIFSAT